MEQSSSIAQREYSNLSMHLNVTESTKTALAEILRNTADWIEESSQPVTVTLTVEFEEKKGKKEITK